ncbi:MAG TPA: hypothetical protein VGR02_00345 [Thermoanaerobaculia bacterium]|jgi:hypothetical protein|nr:hypothetical protein [Thermoanaerobaculia bacterium]
MIPLFLVVAAFLAAPSAMAACVRCKIRAEPHTEPPQCIAALHFGWVTCIEDYDNDTCILGPACQAQAAATATLASEFTVASVERLDEAQPSASRALVASLDAPLPTTR